MAWVSVAVGGATALLGASQANKAANAQQDAAQAQIDLARQMYEDSVARADDNLAAQEAIYGRTLNQQLGQTQQTLNQQLGTAAQTRNQLNALATGYQTDALTSSQRALNAQLGYLSPYADTGYDANAQMAIELGLAPGESGYTATPGYEYTLNEALDAVEGSASAMGGVMSGATMEAQMATAQGLASQDYYNYMAGLDSMSNRGMSASTNMANAQGAADAQRQNIYANTVNLQSAATGNYGNQAYNAYGTQGANNYNAYGSAGANLGAANQNTFNALAGAASNYSADMANAYANMGNTQAAGYMAPYNALMGGVESGLQMYNYMNTPNPWTASTGSGSTVPQSSTNAAASGWGLY